jgi:hypothetical protein
MEKLCHSGALFAKWCPMEPQRSTSENNGSARNFYYNTKNDKFTSSSSPPLYSISNYIPQTSHVASITM